MKIHATVIAGISLLILLPTPALLPRSTEKEYKELRIGLIAPFSGRMEPLGISSVEGARLAVEGLGEGAILTVNGTRYKVTILTRDCKESQEAGVSAASELINRESISVIIGPPLSGVAIPVARVAERSRIPMITQMATHPEVTYGKSFSFRVCFTDDVQGDAIARFTSQILGVRRTAVLYDIANDYNRTLAEIFETRFTEYGGEVTGYESYTTGAENFKEQLVAIREDHPDALFLPNYPVDVLRQVSEMEELGMTVQLIGSDTMSFRDPEDRARIEGAYFSTHFTTDIPSKKVQTFSALYRRRFEQEPTVVGALTYDAMNLLFSVVREVGSVDPADIQKGLKSLKRYEGVTGMMDFNGRSDPVKSVVIIHVENGNFVFFTRIEPAD